MHFLCSLFRHLSPPHDLPQIAENRHGVGRNEFRVLDDSRSHKSPENVAVQRIEKTIAVYNPEVVGSSHAPQSQNRLISMKSDGFSAFASKGFRRNNAILQNLQLPQTMTHTGQKNVPWRNSAVPRLSCCLEPFFHFQIAAVRTFSMVLAASFWAAVVTGA